MPVPELTPADLTRRSFLVRSLQISGGLTLTGVASGCFGGEEPSDSASSGKPAGGEIKILTADASAVEFLTGLAPAYIAAQADKGIDITIDVPANQPPEVRQRYLDQLSLGRPIADSTDLDLEDTWPAALSAKLHEDRLADLTELAKPYLSTTVGELNEGAFQGRTYGIPGLLSAVTYYYREDLFEKAGISPDWTTWDDFIAAGRTLKSKTGAHIIIIEDSTSRHFNYMIPHAGGNIFGSDGEVTLDSDESLEALETLVRLKSEGVAFLTSDFYGAGVWQAYRDDLIGGAYMPNWYGDLLMAPNLKKYAGKFKMAMAPRFDAGFTSARGGAPVYPVTDGPNAEVAFGFLASAFLSTENNVKRFEQFGTPPMNADAYSDPKVADAVHPFLEQKVAPVYVSMIEKFAPVNAHPNLVRAYSMLSTDVVPKVLAGDLDPAEGLKSAADELRQLSD